MGPLDTVFALSSARGRAGVSVFRVSGPASAEAIRRLTRRELPAPRTAALRQVCDPDGDLIDTGLVLWFPAPSSFTGEDVAEFQLHGGPAIGDAFIRALGSIPGLRPADAGEFTRRAFHNGRLDLTAAEGLADLIAADTEQQRRLALRVVQGGLRDLYDGWRQGLLKSQALLEATLDFADEDLPQDILDHVCAGLSTLTREIAAHLADGRRGEIVRDGFTVVLLGPPNVGKSSLLNALAGRDVAIVSPVPGTTRDPVEVSLNLAGYVVTVIDTAGIRDTTDVVETEGIRRARDRAHHADLRIAVSDPPHRPVEDSRVSGEPVDSRGSQENKDSRVSREFTDSRVSPELPVHDARVINKIDLLPETDDHRTHPAAGEVPAFPVSARTGEGIPAFLEWLEVQVVSRAAGSESIPVTRLRHRQALEEALSATMRASANLAAASPQFDLAAEDLRMAASALGRITGRIGVEDLLDVIFREFCIGK